MVSVLRSAIAVSVASVITVFATSVDVRASEQPSSNAGLGGPGQPGTNPSQPPASGPLPPDVARQVTEVIEQNGGSAKQCFPVQQMVEIMAAYPYLAVQVIDFAGEQLSSSSSLLNDNCLCAIDFATAAVSAVPEQANRARFVLEDKYPECTPEVEVAMEETLAELAPGAGNRGPLYNPDFPRPKDTDEWCRDTSSCGPLEETPQDSASPSSLP